MIEHKDFKLFNKIEIFKFYLIEYQEFDKIFITNDGEIEDESNENEGYYHYITPQENIRKERFFVFSRADLKKLEKLNYIIHIYSVKEIKEFRERKQKNFPYTSIHFVNHSVNLLQQKGKNNTRILRTPFIYYDYFILRLNGMLEVKNRFKIDNETEKRDVIQRKFKLNSKAFEYYRYLYNFDCFEYINHKIKTPKEKKIDIEIEAESKKIMQEWWEEEFKSIQQQLLKSEECREKCQQKEYKEPIDKVKNHFRCFNDIEKELDKYNYRIAYEYLKISSLDIFRKENYEREKHLDKIVILAVEKAKNSEYTMEKVNQQKASILPNLEKLKLYS